MPLDELVSADHVQAVQFLGLFFGHSFFLKSRFWKGLFLGRELYQVTVPFARFAAQVGPDACFWLADGTVLAIRVGAKKAVGHIVSKKW